MFRVMFSLKVSLLQLRNRREGGGVGKEAWEEERCEGWPRESASLLHPKIIPLLEHAFSLGVKVQMVTNGTLVKEKHLELLSQLDCLTISVDGTEAAHDRIRARQGTWKRTMQTIRLLTEKSDVQWGTNTVMQRDNYDVLCLVCWPRRCAASSSS